MAQRRQTTRRADVRRQQTRAQRREAERKQRKGQAPKRSISSLNLIGGAIAVIVIAVIAVVVIVRATSLTGSSTGPPVATAADFNPGPMLKTGTTAPDFTLKDLNGKSYNLAAQRGHPVVLEFFAVWCPHCQAMAPVIQNLADTYKSKRVRVWSILSSPYGPNYDNSFGLDRTSASVTDVRNFAKKYGEHVPQLISPNFAVPNTYGGKSYPGIYVVNKKGVIIHASTGERPQSVLASAINSALKGS